MDKRQMIDKLVTAADVFDLEGDFASAAEIDACIVRIAQMASGNVYDPNIANRPQNAPPLSASPSAPSIEFRDWFNSLTPEQKRWIHAQNPQTWKSVEGEAEQWFNEQRATGEFPPRVPSNAELNPQPEWTNPTPADISDYQSRPKPSFWDNFANSPAGAGASGFGDLFKSKEQR